MGSAPGPECAGRVGRADAHGHTPPGRWPTPDLGVRFIPIALDTLTFFDRQRLGLGTAAWDAAYGRAGQEPALRAINEAMSSRLTAPARALVHGAYGSPTPSATTLPAGASYNGGWSPHGTSDVRLGRGPDALPRDVIAPYCRSCYLQLEPSFATGDELRALVSLVYEDVCLNRSMPHSPSTSDHFWRSTTPYAAGVLESVAES